MMLRLFKRRRPLHRAEPTTTRSDILTAYAWGLNLTQWNSLTDHDRAECRRTITAAPNFRNAA